MNIVSSIAPRFFLPLALAAAATLTPHAASAQEAAPLGDGPVVVRKGGPATVVVTSDNLDVRVGVVTGRAEGMVSNGVSVQAIGWKNVCMAPCEFQLEPGLHELTATGPGYTPAVEEVSLAPGENHFRVKPGSSYMRLGGWTLAGVGVAGLALGITFAAVGTSSVGPRGQFTHETPAWAIPVAIGGGVGLAGGIALVALSGTSIQRDVGAPRERASTTPGVGYVGAF